MSRDITIFNLFQPKFISFSRFFIHKDLLLYLIMVINKIIVSIYFDYINQFNHEILKGF